MATCKDCIHYSACINILRKAFPKIPDKEIAYASDKSCCTWFRSTADVVEVVRCKDCVHYCGFEHCKNGICDRDSVSKRAVYPTDFCSCGEKKES